MSFHNELSYCGSSPLSHPQNWECVSTGSEDRVSLPVAIYVLSGLPHLPSLVRLAFSCPSITTWAKLLLIRPSVVNATAVSLGDAGGEDGAPATKMLRRDLEQLQQHIWNQFTCVTGREEKKGKSWGTCDAQFIASQVHLFVFHTSFQLRRASSTGAGDLVFATLCLPLFLSNNITFAF